MVDSGQFIGFKEYITVSLSYSSVKSRLYILCSPNLSQWPDSLNNLLLTIIGVEVSKYPAASVNSLMYFSSSLKMTIPRGSQKGAPGAISVVKKSSSSWPNCLWSFKSLIWNFYLQLQQYLL